MRRILTDYRAWIALLAITLVLALLGDARAGAPSGSGEVGWTVEQNGKKVEYLFNEKWRGEFRQTGLTLTNPKLGLEIHYYGSFCVSHRVRKR